MNQVRSHKIFALQDVFVLLLVLELATQRFSIQEFGRSMG
jgi:hypothetical protein